MHEYPLTQRIVDIAQQRARECGSGRVMRIELVIGEDSGVCAESIELYFDLIAAGSLCADAALSIERVKPRLRCAACGALFERRPFSFACTAEGCIGEGRPTDIGREFLVRAIHLQQEDQTLGQDH